MVNCLKGKMTWFLFILFHHLLKLLIFYLQFLPPYIAVEFNLKGRERKDEFNLVLSQILYLVCSLKITSTPQSANCPMESQI